MRGKRRRELLLLLAAGALIAGCGSSSSSSGQALTPAAWKQKVDGICSTVTAQSKQIVKPTVLSGVNPYIQKIIDLGNSEIAQIKAVNPPSQFAAGQRAVVGDLSSIYASLQNLVNRHLSGAALQRAFAAFPASVQTPAADYVSRSKAAGLSSCVLSSP